MRSNGTVWGALVALAAVNGVELVSAFRGKPLSGELQEVLAFCAVGMVIILSWAVYAPKKK